ncbi:MAG TPA: PQQ-binding-like beta-propeller repeat protein [Streptosporangiaceae bacterium]|nr:PQQ-binding-like beta-propeller repeat protein [Streptosporangiaceae bacterium]
MIVVLGFVAWYLNRVHKQTSSAASHTTRPPAAPRSWAAAESGLLPWHLRTPLSREVVLPGHGDLVVLGGLTDTGASTGTVYSLGLVRGVERHIGALPVPVHDAAVGLTGSRALVFGGGSSTSIATVQGITLSRGGAAGSVGSLPALRSDAVGVTIGSTTYVVGGYTGTRPDAAVLATADGHSFAVVANLPVPVRYPAVTTLDGQIYVFGGQAVTGSRAGKPVDDIQVVDPAHHSAAIVGHLPEPLSGSAAMTLNGEILLAGGESSTPQHDVRGAGTTQLTPGESSTANGAVASSLSTADTIWAFDPASRRMLVAGRLQVPVSHAGVAVTGSTGWLVGGESHGTMVDSVQMIKPNRAFGTAGAAGAGSPYFGAKLLIADRGNDRLLLMDDTMKVVWRYPAPNLPRDPLGFYFPDDAFFAQHGSVIVSNQEQNNTILEIAYPSGKIVWSYGHPRQRGAAPGYLYEPDDAYLLKNGQITVADAYNCRVLVINPNHTLAHQIGTVGQCVHHPPTAMAPPNGDTPLQNGDLLISEINGSWVSEYTPAGKLVWDTQLPISYPSDPQQLGADRYLIADYAAPGQILEFDRAGHVLYRYRAPFGTPGMLDHPSLTELLPSGVFMANDDYNDRMVAIDPSTGALVWQYGVTRRPGTGPGELKVPDGFDLLLPNGSTPTHPFTG